MTEQVYLVFEVKECDDHYYAPYHRLLGIYKQKQHAIEVADYFLQQAREGNHQRDFYVLQQRVRDEPLRAADQDVVKHHELHNAFIQPPDSYVFGESDEEDDLQARRRFFTSLRHL